MTKYLASIKELLFQEYFQWILWIPVFYGIGILIYLNLSFEPSITFLISLLLFSFLCIYWSRHNISHLYLNIFIISIISGTSFASVKGHLNETVIIHREYKFLEITGIIEHLKIAQKGYKLTLSNINFIGILPRSDFNKINKIKLNVKSSLNGAKIGDLIQLKISIMPNISEKIKPGTDYNIVNFFEGVQANAYAVSKVQVLQKLNQKSFDEWIENIRNNIETTLHNEMGKEIGPVAAALLIGETAAINQEIIDNMRKSGLSHILAVSGLHLSLVVGICFLIFRNIIALFPTLCLRYNSKKIAAIIAILASYIYLKISGQHIAATRAFIMSLIIIIGILIDRISTPLRSIGLAALVILFMKPESIIHPSFQMSFMAVLALIAFYQLYVKYIQSKLYHHNTIARIGSYVIGISVSSIFAGLSTAPFTIYHFNQYSNYAILANIFVIPLVSFIIMPLIVAWGFLYCLHLQHLINFLLKQSIAIMLKIAAIVSQIPGSAIQFASIDGITLGLLVLGIIILALFQTKLRFIGIIFVIFGMIVNLTATKPSLIIFPETQKFTYFDDSNRTIYLSKSRFSKRLMEELTSYYQPENNIRLFDNNKYLVNKKIQCNDYGCFINDKNSVILITDDTYYASKHCDTINLLINFSEYPTECEKEYIINYDDKFIFIFEGQVIKKSKSERLWNK